MKSNKNAKFDTESNHDRASERRGVRIKSDIKAGLLDVPHCVHC